MLIKRGTSGLFDISVGSLNEVEVCELAKIYLLADLSNIMALMLVFIEMDFYNKKKDKFL